MPKVSKVFARGHWLRQRETGFSQPSKEWTMKALYAHFQPCSAWRRENDAVSYSQYSDHGGILNVDFSSDGVLLVAGCEKNSVLMFDPLSHNLLQALDCAHDGAVNCVKFLDDRTFASCSDDHVVALWDSRNLKSRVRTFVGHKSCVKNIEYSSVDKLLITSAFDGVVNTWDINKYHDAGCSHKQVFHTTHLVRTCLAPDCSKLVISARGGYLLVIHDLQLDSLGDDVHGFKPNLYHMMLLNRSPVPSLSRFDYLFSRHRKANRFEFVSDFPSGDDPELISSIQVHPQGFCVASRNVSFNDSEWTCVHDLREPSSVTEEDNYDVCKENIHFSDSGHDENGHNPTNSISNQTSSVLRRTHVSSSPRFIMNTEDPLSSASHSITPSRSPSSFLFQRRVTFTRNSDRNPDELSGRLPSNPLQQIRVHLYQPALNFTNQFPRTLGEPTGMNLVERNLDGHIIAYGSSSVSRYAVPFSSGGAEEVDESRDGQIIHNHPSTSHGTPVISREERLTHHLQITSNLHVTANSERPSRRVVYRRSLRQASQHSVAVQNSASINVDLNAASVIHPPVLREISRLSHYAREPNLGKGLVKGISFSPDGRIICSPYDKGIRLLSFNPDLTDDFDSPGPIPVELHELFTRYCHNDLVLCSKFSPKHFFVVSGCLDGELIWHQPAL